jgi:hypothetical protein
MVPAAGARLAALCSFLLLLLLLLLLFRWLPLLLLHIRKLQAGSSQTKK